MTHDPQSTAAIQTQAIEKLSVGQRVLAHNPEVSPRERRSWGPEPDFSQWLHLTLEMPKEDGSTLTIQMLRPDEWVDSQLSYVIDEPDQGSRHSPSDEAQRGQTAEIENHRRDKAASQIVWCRKGSGVFFLTRRQINSTQKTTTNQDHSISL